MERLLNHFLFLLLLCLVSRALVAQTYSISGQISIANSKKLPADFKIILLETQEVAELKDDLTYKFDSLRAGNYTLITYSFGFQSVTKKVRIADKDIRLNLEVKNLEKELDAVTISSSKTNDFGINKLNSVDGTAIYAGKKSEVVLMEDVSGNLASNNSREIYAKVSGLNIWENDGAGLQLAIGGRGLSPSRASNFNTRQNGYDISADALGYPESYYSPPAEAIEQIEIVRGAASLQYGTQFGGMLNFKLHDGPEKKKIELKARQSLGSFGFYNSFVSVGGNKGRWKYYSFYQFKKGNGWRPNSAFQTHLAHSNIGYNATSKFSVKVEYTYMNYLANQPGGLTDALFNDDPRQSIRERNWFSVNWNLFALSMDYKFNERNEFNSRTFGLVAGRDALGFLGQISRSDPNQERDLLSDRYNNIGNESRFIHRYEMIDNQVSAFLTGVRYYSGNTRRKQGDANQFKDADFTFLNPKEPEHSSYVFPSQNWALFVENMFQLSNRLSVTPGLRTEYIQTTADGYYKLENRNRADSIIFSELISEEKSNDRAFILAGLGLSFKFNNGFEFYANYSQNYRSINFNDMRVVNPNFRVDPNLKDETGFSSDLGIRGNKNEFYYFDFSLFYLKYNNRIGEVLRRDELLFTPYRFRTNIADSRTYGVESMGEISLNKLFDMKGKSRYSVFSNLSWMKATYINSEEEAFEGKEVELVPSVIYKSGLSWKRNRWKWTCQYSYTAQQYTDATNAEFTSNAVNGIVPAYYIMDLSIEYGIKNITAYAGVNNLTNNSYFTRRASGYPGPGIIPADARSFYFTLQLVL